LVVQMCPTTPLVRAEDIDRGVEILLGDPLADSVILMSPAREHPRKSAKIAADGRHAVSYLTDRGADLSPTNRQSYAVAYTRESLPVVSRRRTVLELGSQTGERVRFHVIDAATAFDIDTDQDFRVVEALLGASRSPEG